MSSVPPSSVITVKQYSGLPSFHKVLTAPLPHGVLQVADDIRESLAALGTDDKTVFLAVIPSFVNAPQTRTVRERLIKLGYSISDKLYVTDPGVLRLVYNRLQSEKDGMHESQDQIERAFNELVSDCLAKDVSDIHIEVTHDICRVRVRIHGKLVDYAEWAPDYGREIINVVYTVIAETGSKDVVFSPTQYQAASIRRVLLGRELKIRFASSPMYPDGFYVVMRLLPMGEATRHTSITDLGYSESHLRMLRMMNTRPTGVIIIAGTTGSGKSTTLKHLVSEIWRTSNGELNLLTVEDPPEYLIEGAHQIPVVRRAGAKDDDNPFEAPIVTAMRQDPDVIMIGEVRDERTAELLTRAVESGHRVLTTVHAASAIGIINRVALLGIERAILGSPDFLSGLVYQRLLPVVCPKCSQPFNMEREDAELVIRLRRVMQPYRNVNLGDGELRRKQIGARCERCNGKGIIGRTVCAEAIVPDYTMLDFIIRGDDMGMYRYWRGLWNKNMDHFGGRTALDHAIYKMRQGLIDPYDAEQAFGYLTIQSALEEGKLRDEYGHDRRAA